MDRFADIVDMDTRDVFMEEQFKRDCRAAGIRLDIFAIEQPVFFQQALSHRAPVSLCRPGTAAA